MTDRELLEAASKAAGIHVGFSESTHDEGKPYAWNDDGKTSRWWNPLTDDGDALRLAVMCGLAVIPYPIYTQPKHSVIAKVYKDSQAVYRDEEKRIEQIEVYGSDPAAATRRAIVRAAAALSSPSQGVQP